MNKQCAKDMLRLVESSRDAIACSVDENGFPNAKTMFRRKSEGLHTFWFSTNVSAIRTGQWQRNPKACVYFWDTEGFHGLMLTGTMRVFADDETKLLFWQDGDEQYYPLGPADPDYCMLRFTAEKGNYYHGISKLLFEVSEAEAAD